jgi:hypothetical protein
MCFCPDKGRSAAKAAVFACVILFCLVGLCSMTAGASPAQGVPGSLSIWNSYAAIADFDGDRKPDLASVEIQRAYSNSNALYSIRFELTAGHPQIFGVTAPVGGLQIVARDVNSDTFLDLLVSTAWQHIQVAVLLNDGHGNFRLADPAAFPGAIRECEASWDAKTLPASECSLFVRSNDSTGRLEATRRFECLHPQFEHAPFTAFSAPNALLIFSLRGRAPPPVVLQA